MSDLREIFLYKFSEVVNGSLSQQKNIPPGRRALLHEFWVKFPAAYTGSLTITRVDTASTLYNAIVHTASITSATEYYINDLNVMCSSANTIKVETSTTCASSSTVYTNYGWFNNSV